MNCFLIRLPYTHSFGLLLRDTNVPDKNIIVRLFRLLILSLKSHKHHEKTFHFPLSAVARSC